MSKLQRRGSISRSTAKDTQSFLLTSSDLTCVSGKTKFATFRAHIAALPTMHEVIRRATFPQDPAAYGWERSVEDIGAVMNGLSIDHAHIVGVSMGAYAALQFGLRYPERVRAIVAAAAGSGSSPSGRHAWLRETSILARAFGERGSARIAEKIATSPARLQLKYKDPKRWREFADQLRQQSGRGCRIPSFAAKRCAHRCMICATSLP
jgi:pimeloyl-ACP methyl ester carboxylesterase